jgi:hypothetical protein
MEQDKTGKGSEERDEILEACKWARIRASKHTPEQRKAAIARAMRLIYADSPTKDSVGAGQ